MPTLSPTKLFQKLLAAARCAVKRRHRYWSPWCDLLGFHLSQRGLSESRFGKQLGIAQQTMHTYNAGLARPPLELLPSMVKVLQLQGADAQRFVHLAYQAWTRPEIWDELERLKAQVAEMEQAYKPQDATPAPVGPAAPAADPCAPLLALLRELYINLWSKAGYQSGHYGRLRNQAELRQRVSDELRARGVVLPIEELL